MCLALLILGGGEEETPGEGSALDCSSLPGSQVSLPSRMSWAPWGSVAAGGGKEASFHHICEPAYNRLVLLGIKEGHLFPSSRDWGTSTGASRGEAGSKWATATVYLPLFCPSVRPPPSVPDGLAQWVGYEHLGFLCVPQEAFQANKLILILQSGLKNRSGS